MYTFVYSNVNDKAMTVCDSCMHDSADYKLCSGVLLIGMCNHTRYIKCVCYACICKLKRKIAKGYQPKAVDHQLWSQAQHLTLYVLAMFDALLAIII